MTVGFVCDAYFKHALIFQISPFMFVATTFLNFDHQ
jgi:hypothetical protein